MRMAPFLLLVVVVVMIKMRGGGGWVGSWSSFLSPRLEFVVTGQPRAPCNDDALSTKRYASEDVLAGLPWSAALGRYVSHCLG